MLQESAVEDLIQFSSPKPNPNLIKSVKTLPKTPVSLLDSSLLDTTAVNAETTNQDQQDNDQTTLNVNDSNLDIVEFIEVDNDLINTDHEDFWLCDPKTNQTARQKQKRKDRELELEKENLNREKEREASRLLKNEDDFTLNITNSNMKPKNPYKWIMEEFDHDKNLDKVKRTLLVTLDDISKGFSKILTFH